MSGLSAAQLILLREQMLTIKQQLEQVFDDQQLQTEPVILDQQAVGRVSRIDAIQQQQMAMANQQYTGQHLTAINAALRRLDEEDYGFCEECGHIIAFARLKIKPEALFCIACQGGHEQ